MKSALRLAIVLTFLFSSCQARVRSVVHVTSSVVGLTALLVAATSGGIWGRRAHKRMQSRKNMAKLSPRDQAIARAIAVMPVTRVVRKVCASSGALAAACAAIWWGTRGTVSDEQPETQDEEEQSHFELSPILPHPKPPAIATPVPPPPSPATPPSSVPDSEEQDKRKTEPFKETEAKVGENEEPVGPDAAASPPVVPPNSLLPAAVTPEPQSSPLLPDAPQAEVKTKALFSGRPVEEAPPIVVDLPRASGAESPSSHRSLFICSDDEHPNGRDDDLSSNGLPSDGEVQNALRSEGWKWPNSDSDVSITAGPCEKCPCGRYYTMIIKPSITGDVSPEFAWGCDCFEESMPAGFVNEEELGPVWGMPLSPHCSPHGHGLPASAPPAPLPRPSVFELVILQQKLPKMVAYAFSHEFFGVLNNSFAKGHIYLEARYNDGRPAGQIYFNHFLNACDRSRVKPITFTGPRDIEKWAAADIGIDVNDGKGNSFCIYDDMFGPDKCYKSLTPKVTPGHEAFVTFVKKRRARPKLTTPVKTASYMSPTENSSGRSSGRKKKKKSSAKAKRQRGTTSKK